MLILSRKRGESIWAGAIEITVMDVRGDRARIGIEATKDVPVNRKEVLQAIACTDLNELEGLGYTVTKDGVVVPILTCIGAAA